jgi:hypothetical protein
MLAFDIETTGLDMEKHTITVVALYGDVPGAAGRVDTVLHFGRDGADAHLGTLRALLAAADTLCAFNAVRFDIPFIVRTLGVPPAEAGGWVAKLYDPFEEHKLLTDRPISLNKMLARFGLQGKSGTGAQAVQLARDREWEPLALYCRQDAVLTHELAGLLLTAAPRA